MAKMPPIELNEQQKEIVTAIEDLNESCTVYTGRILGKSTIVAHLSKKYDCPILVPNMSMGQTLREKGVPRKHIISSHNVNMARGFDKLIIDEINYCKHLPQPCGQVMIAFTSNVRDDWKELHGLKNMKLLNETMPDSAFISGFIIKPGIEYIGRTVKIDKCARCGEIHVRVKVNKLRNACDEYDHFFMCPTTLQPVVMNMNVKLEE